MDAHNGYIVFEPTRRHLTPPGIESIEIKRELPRGDGCGGNLLRLATLSVGLVAPVAMVLVLSRNATMLVAIFVAALTAVFGAVGVFVAWYISTHERRSYERYLTKMRQTLHERIQNRQQLAYELHPEPRALQHVVQRSLERSYVRLWERRPDEKQPDDKRDFLKMRIGMATDLPTEIDLKLPSNLERLNRLGAIERLTQALVEESRRFPGTTPYVLDLKKVGIVGIVGDRPQRQGLVRAILSQLCTFHSPDYVNIVCLAPRIRQREWFWLGWMPHAQHQTDVPSVACAPERIHAELHWLKLLITEREETKRKSSEHAQPRAIIVVLDDYPTLQREMAAYYADLREKPADASPFPPVALDTDLIVHGARHNVFFVCLTDDRRDLMPECRASIIIESAQYAYVDDVTPVVFSPDNFSQDDCDALAQQLAPVIARGAAQAGITGMVPDSCDLMPLLDWYGDTFTPENLLTHWDNTKTVNLKIALGIGEDGKPLVLDVDESVHGPHGMLIGRTGSGKGELLLNLVTNLAINNHPESLNLLLADFKGGATFNVFETLPHCVGNVTNLSLSTTHEVERFLEALLSELRRREGMIAEAQRVYGPEVQKIGQYRAIAKDLPPMPYLIVIIDEFATMKEIAPMRIKDLIEIGNKGRSAGVFLLLAMQSPQGVIPEKLAANLTYRVALKVNNALDSNDVIGSKAAAEQLTGDVRGRGYFRNNATLKMFQGARVMGNALSHQSDDSAPDNGPTIIRLDWSWGKTPYVRPQPKATLRTGTAARAIPDVTKVVQAAQDALKIRPPSFALQRPWLPPLPTQLPMTRLLSGVFTDDEHFVGFPPKPPYGWMHVPLAMVDRITQQPYLMSDLGKHHIQILGVPPNEGRTNALLAVTLGIAAQHAPTDMQLLVFDSGFSLKPLAALPHDVQYFAADGEALKVALEALKGEMERRQEMFNKVEKGVVINDLYDYRTYQAQRRPNDEIEQEYVLVLEDYLAWRKRLEKIDYAALDILRDFVQNGQRYGIHLIITAARSYDVESDNYWKSFYTMQLEMDSQNLKGSPGDKEMLESWNNKTGRGFTESARPNRLEEAQVVCVVSGTEEAQQTMAYRLVAEIAQAANLPLPAAA